jgi:H+/Cl- antiporter ClcA
MLALTMIRLHLGQALYKIELFDHGRLRWVLVIAVLLAILSGFVAGLACHCVNVGLSVSSGVSAWISDVECLLVGQYR